MRGTQNLFLGVDGGGTKCRARIMSQDGMTLGSGSGGNANIGLGLDVVFTSIETATREALAQAGLSEDYMSRLHAGLGLAGAIDETDRESVTRFANMFASATVWSDAYVACLGAHAGQPGGIVILGTGSCGCVISDAGVTHIGGWGFELGDSGSGAWLGQLAIRQALLAYDGLANNSPLTDAINNQFNNTPMNMVRWAKSAIPSDFSSFAPLVSEYATKHDETAVVLMRRTGQEVTKLIEAVLGYGVERVALMGGMANAVTPYLSKPVRKATVKSLGDAVDGALLMAQAHVGKITGD